MLLNEVSVFSANSSPPNGLCFFSPLPLEQATSFQGAFPGSNVEGRSDHVQLNTFFFFSVIRLRLLSDVSFAVSF